MDTEEYKTNRIYSVARVIANQAALNYGMAATGSHWAHDSLRGAPLVWQSPSIFSFYLNILQSKIVDTE